MPASLLILPGLDGTGVPAGPFVKYLAGRLSPVVVTFPLRHHLDRAELAARVLAAWPAGGPVVVLGQSFSTAVAVAVAVARARPSGLAGLVLVTPTFAARVRWPVRLAIGAHRPWLPAVRPPEPALRWMLTSGHRPAGDLLMRAVRETDARVVLARLRDYVADPAADDPAGVNVPVLAVRAARDRVLASRRIVPRPGLEWVTLDAPHLASAAAPEALADAVVRFAGRRLE